MRYTGLKTLLIVWFLIVSGMCADASEAKGYKIVLAAFPTFDEAKTKLRILGEELGAQEKALQEEYGYEIVARPSGRSYIIGIEPIRSKKGRDSVLRTFKRFYRDAYSDTYYGPTQGAVFLETIRALPADESEATEKPDAGSEGIGDSEEMNQTAHIEEATNPTPAAADEPEAAAAEENPNQEEGTVCTATGQFWPIAAVVLFLIGFIVWVKRINTHNSSTTHRAETHTMKAEDADVADLEDDKPLAESFEMAAETVEIESDQSEPDVETPAGKKSEEPLGDIFYRLKQNPFFMTVLQELKEAADNQDSQRCKDLMDELERYQKSFRPSDILAQMKELTEAKELGRLSMLIVRETGQ